MNFMSVRALLGLEPDRPSTADVRRSASDSANSSSRKGMGGPRSEEVRLTDQQAIKDMLMDRPMIFSESRFQQFKFCAEHYNYSASYMTFQNDHEEIVGHIVDPKKIQQQQLIYLAAEMRLIGLAPPKKLMAPTDVMKNEREALKIGQADRLEVEVTPAQAAENLKQYHNKFMDGQTEDGSSESESLGDTDQQEG